MAGLTCEKYIFKDEIYKNLISLTNAPLQSILMIENTNIEYFTTSKERSIIFISEEKDLMEIVLVIKRSFLIQSEVFVLQLKYLVH